MYARYYGEGMVDIAHNYELRNRDMPIYDNTRVLHIIIFLFANQQMSGLL